MMLLTLHAVLWPPLMRYVRAGSPIVCMVVGVEVEIGWRLMLLLPTYATGDCCRWTYGLQTEAPLVTAQV